MLVIKELTYQINHTVILDRLQLEVDTGQFYALAGANGAGKSTLIKIILDLIREVDSGEISILGQNHKEIRVRDSVAYLPEKFNIKKEVTGAQYLKFIAGVYRKKLDNNKVESLCINLGFDTSRLQHKTNDYSKGMRQKLGLISCFMLDTPMIVLDEPLSGLDPRARFLFKQILKQERESGRTIFYSTHMLADAEEICDRFGILHQGRIVFDGTPADCIARYRTHTLEQAYMSCISQAEEGRSLVN